MEQKNILIMGMIVIAVLLTMTYSQSLESASSFSEELGKAYNWLPDNIKYPSITIIAGAIILTLFLVILTGKK